MPARRKDINTLSEFFALRRYRKGIETVSSQLERMGIGHLKAHSNEGLKAHASLLALICTNFDRAKLAIPVIYSGSFP